jgi:hypothetical protein
MNSLILIPNSKFFVILGISSSLLFAPLIANAPTAVPESSSLSSSDASYDGNSLLLTGHVVLDHGLGKMMAEEASLQRQEAGKDFPFSLIQLRKEVLLALKNSAQITCGSADLDFTTLKGTLYPSNGNPVVYSDQIKKKKGGEALPLKLSGQLIELLFSKQPQEGKKTEYDIQTVLAKEDVVINYADNFELRAGQALYRKETTDNKSSQREFQGVITAYPKEGMQCRLSHQGDVIDADTADFDLVNARISLLHPKGVLATAILPNVQKGEMHFHSDHLYWDQHRNALTLKGNIFIQEASIGTFNAQDELQLVQTVNKGKTVLKSIQTQGPASLVYQDEHQHQHKLISQGTVHLDRDKLRATIESPENEGIVAQDKQLYYQEEELAVFADHASLEYSVVDDALQPTSLSLKGNIRFFSHDPQKPLRCGASDRLTYSLTTRTFILSANPGKKVLFWDEAQGMRLSAPEVHITYDPETKQQNIKGVGAVQFAFTPDEQHKLFQLFPQLKKSP